MEVCREGLQTYLRTSVEDNDYFCNVEYQVIHNNSVDSLLPIQLREEDHRHQIFYEITGKQSVEELKKDDVFSEKECRQILGDIIAVLMDVEEYMLVLEHIPFSAASIYQNVDGKNYFVYNPTVIYENQNDIVDLFSWILEHIDYEDRKAVEFIYHVFYAVKKQDVTKQLLEECLKYQVRKEITYDAFFEKSEENESWIQAKPTSVTTSNTNGSNNLSGIGYESSAKSMYAYDAGHYSFNMYGDSVDEEVKGKSLDTIYLLLMILFILLAISVASVAGFFIYYGVLLGGFPIYGRYAVGCMILFALLLYGAYQMNRIRKESYLDEEIVTKPEHSVHIGIEHTNSGSLTSGFGPDTTNTFRNKESSGFVDTAEHTTLLSAYKTRDAGEETTLLFQNNKKDRFILRSMNTGAVYMIKNFPVVIGSDASQCQIVITDSTISRRHAMISYQPLKEEYYIEDLNSSNGTCLDYVPVQAGRKTVLEVGQTLTLARLNFQFCVLE